MAKCTSDWSRNKVSHRLKIENIKKRVSFTTMPIYSDDVTDDKFLARITERFDDGEVYETTEVSNQNNCITKDGFQQYLMLGGVC